ncbi:hypothetical protein ACIQWR_26850 [Streptomyces sp. NPDC098789]|uniref:hypothetical protein n=1 Tax=Streptomyces sp. NPDC098789 TaxID=3366098 RepID=UPI003800AF50
MNDPALEAAARPEGWAERVVARLAAVDALEQDLIGAVHGQPDLIAETGARRARALHAAAMGLGPAGCAAAAGVSEALLIRWRRDPAFDAALVAATALAASLPVAPHGRLNGFALGILLRSLAREAHLGTAARAAGLTRDQLTRIRRSNAAVNDLVEAALRGARVRYTEKRGRKRPYGYRLVHRAGTAPPEGPGTGGGTGTDGG